MVLRHPLSIRRGFEGKELHARRPNPSPASALGPRVLPSMTSPGPKGLACMTSPRGLQPLGRGWQAQGVCSRDAWP